MEIPFYLIYINILKVIIPSKDSKLFKSSMDIMMVCKVFQGNSYQTCLRKIPNFYLTIHFPINALLN